VPPPHALLTRPARSPPPSRDPRVDHAGTAGTFAGDLPIYVHPDDAVAFDDPVAWGGPSASSLEPAKDLRSIAHGEILRVAGSGVEVLHTPGHTPGHCCFRIDDDVLVFSGDLVFAGTIGRSDFANSDPRAMRESLLRFLLLPNELRTLPGHGPETMVGIERRSNPFLVELG
jgi:glyoxylase-like metal-dependent hydrolase (beta-lactamase superfamily II)